MRTRMVDYLIDRIYEAGAHHVFFVPGTGCMFLTDALARKKELVDVSVHHEQAAGMAALTYAKLNERLGACVVTTGCGGTNAVTACLNAWQDNVPCVFISGQAARHQTVRNSKVPLRQMGRQEADIVAIVGSITKYAVMINDPSDTAYEIDKALYEAQNGRKGPVWIDVPMDIQNSIIDTDELRRFIPETEDELVLSNEDKAFLVTELKKAERPVILAGNGIRLAGAVDDFDKLVDKIQIPVTYTRLGHDLLDADHPMHIGMVGMLGASRAGNFAVANADLVISLGTRLSIDTTSYEYEKFARAAKLIVIDIDEVEHQKDTVKIDKFIKADAKKTITSLLNEELSLNIAPWREKCAHWKATYPVCEEQYKQGDLINMYYFTDALSDVLPDNAVVMSDAGNTFFTVSPVVRVKRARGQRSVLSGAQAEMGYALPGSIGASFATDGPIIPITGDGSVMMNIQELETMSFLHCNIKLCIMNNNGYSSIRQLQNNAFRGRLIGCDPSNGCSFPDFEAIAKAFKLKYVRIEGSDHLQEKIKNMLAIEGPVLCEVMCVTEQPFLGVSTGKNSKGRIVNRPIEDQAPFLDREVFMKEMIIDPLD